MAWSDGCNDGLFSQSELLDPNRDQNNILKFQAPVLPYMQFSHGPPFCFLLCHLLIPSPFFSKSVLSCELSYISTGDRNAFLCPIPRSLVVVGSYCSWSSWRNVAVATCFLQACCWGLWSTATWTLVWGLVGKLHCWHFTGSSAPSQLGSSPSLEPGSFLMLTTVIICLLQLLGLT